MRIFVLSKKKLGLILCGVLLFVAAILLSVWPQSDAVLTSVKVKRLPIYGVNTKEKKLALTFDCAWENRDTKELLQLLHDNKVPATFFATGDWCSRFPDDVKAFAAAGHDIENHSYAHPHVASIKTSDLLADTEKCSSLIESLTKKRPTLYRAPYGEYSDSMLEALEKAGYQVIQWDADSVDWRGREAADMVASVSKKVRPGSILLFHNDTKNTPAALRQLLPQLKGEGYQFVLVKDLIYHDRYTLDHEGRQTKQNQSSTAITSTSAKVSFGKEETAAQDRAGSLVK